MSTYLTVPFHNKWPPIDAAVEAEILIHLSSVFEKYQGCLRSVKKPPKWKKDDPVELLTDKEKEEKKKFRSWLAIGCNSVLRALEGDKCRLVLMCRTTQPADLKRAVLSLVISRQCPSACVSDILTPVKKFWGGMTSLTALGILKSDEPNEFDCLVDYVKSAVPIIDNTGIPTLLQKSQNETDVKGLTNSEDKQVKDIQASNTTTAKTIKQVKSVTQSEGKASATESTTPSAPKKVNYAKYYIYKDSEKNKKAFEGQDFIGFGEDIVNSSREETKARDSERTSDCFGIRPSLICEVDLDPVSEGDAKRVAGKRKASETGSFDSGYRGINVKQLKKNNTGKKNKKKTKGQVGKKKAG